LNSRLICPGKSDVVRGRNLLGQWGLDIQRPIVIIHPGSGGRRKCWCLENFLGVAERVSVWPAEVIFLLGPAELERFSREELAEISRFGRCVEDISLGDVCALLSCTDFYVGNDSGITHLAGAMGVKTVAVFGPTEPEVYRPIGPSVNIVHQIDADFAERPSAEFQEEVCEKLRI